MPGMDELEECATFPTICSLELRLADGLRIDSVRRVLRDDEKNFVLCLYEVTSFESS